MLYPIELRVRGLETRSQRSEYRIQNEIQSEFGSSDFFDMITGLTRLIYGRNILHLFGARCFCRILLIFNPFNPVHPV